MMDMNTNQAVVKYRIGTYVGLGVFLFAGYILLLESTWVGNKQIHTLMELLATFLAAMVGTLALVRYYSQKDNTFLLIGAAFVGTALLDGYHTVVTSTFFDFYFPSPAPSLIPWSWNASRTYLSIFMLLSWVAWRKENIKGEEGRVREIAVYAGMGILTLAFFIFFAFIPLPRAYYPEFIFGRPEEFISAAFFLMALIGYYRKGAWKTDVFEHWVVLSLIVGFLGQAIFMSSSFQLFDTMFDLAHLLKKVSYFAVLTGLFISVYTTHKTVYRQQGELLKEVADRQQAEAVARATSSRLSSLIENLHAGILVENNSRHIAVVNQPFCDLFGIPAAPAVLLGTDCSNAAEESKHLFIDPQAFVERIDQILQKREIVTGELLYLVDGRTFERDYVPIFVGDLYEGHAWQYVDITERKKSEAKMQDYAQKLEWTNIEISDALTKAEEATQAKSAFLASMSHELRTPLNSIIGFANVLQKNKAQNLNDKELKYLERLTVNATDLLNLINDILDISKIEAGEIALDETAINLGELIHETVDQLKGHARVRETKFIVELPEDVAPLRTDRTRLKQILVNLIGNALKFTDHGTVTVSVEANPDTHAVKNIHVRDTGIGIPADRLEMIFEAFQQADNSIAQKYGGTGLGLAISRRICQAMGCQLTVESEEGLGSTFTVAFQNEGE